MTMRIHEAWPSVTLILAAACSHGVAETTQPPESATGANDAVGGEVATPLVSSAFPNERAPGAVGTPPVDSTQLDSAQGTSATGSTRVVFRARPGRRLVGSAEVHPSENGAILRVSVEEAPLDLERLRFFKVDNCAVFGVGPGSFRSSNLGVPDDLAAIGELRLEQGRGTRAYELEGLADGSASLSGKAVVAFGPIDAYGDQVTEPLACADIPRS